MAATFMFEPGWNLIDFIDKGPGDPKTIWSNPAQTYSHLTGGQ